MSYLIKMLIKKGICCLLSFNGNLWGLEKGRGVFCRNTFHCEALMDRVPPSGNASDLSSFPLSQCLGFHFKKRHIKKWNSFPASLSSSACRPLIILIN